MLLYKCNKLYIEEAIESIQKIYNKKFSKIEYPKKQTIINDIINGYCYLLKIDNKNIGTGTLYPHKRIWNNYEWSASKKAAYIARIAIRPLNQKQGLMKVLLYLMVLEAKRLSYEFVRLIVEKNNLPALHVYNDFGFICKGSYIEDQLTYIRMELNLNI